MYSWDPHTLLFQNIGHVISLCILVMSWISLVAYYIWKQGQGSVMCATYLSSTTCLDGSWSIKMKAWYIQYVSMLLQKKSIYGLNRYFPLMSKGEEKMFIQLTKKNSMLVDEAIGWHQPQRGRMLATWSSQVGININSSISYCTMSR